MTDNKITSYDEAIKYITNLKTYCHICEKLSKDLLDNKELIIFALQNKHCYCDRDKFSIHLQNDYDIAKLIITRNGFKIRYFNYEIQTNEELILLAIKDDENILNRLINDMTNPLTLTHDFSITVLQHNPKCIKFVNKSFRKDIKVMLDVVNKDGEMIKYAHYSIIDNDLLITLAINNSVKAIKYIVSNKQTPEIAIKVLSSNYYSLIQYIRHDLLIDQDIILKALEYTPNLFVNLQQKHVKLDKLIDNFDYFIKKYLKEDGNRLNIELSTFLLDKYTYEQTKNIILKTHITRWSLYRELSNELKNDEEIILKFVLINKSVYKSVPDTITKTYKVDIFTNTMKAYCGDIYIKEQGEKVKKWPHIDINFRFN